MSLRRSRLELAASMIYMLLHQMKVQVSWASRLSDHSLATRSLLPRTSTSLPPPSLIPSTHGNFAVLFFQKVDDVVHDLVGQVP